MTLLQYNYRVYDFVRRDPSRTPHGRFIHRNSNVHQRYLPCAEPLRDHFRQCVLRRVKGAGEGNDAERRFYPDIDLGGEGFDFATGNWWPSSEGKRELEAELATRLWAVDRSKSGGCCRMHSGSIQ